MIDESLVDKEIVLPPSSSAGHVSGNSVETGGKSRLDVPGRILFSADDIKQKVRRLGSDICADYRDANPILVGILCGSVTFMADLIREIDIPMEVDWLAISSYSGQSSSGVVRLLKDLDTTIKGRHVLLIEDIVDTGLTVNYVMSMLETRQPASLKLCALLNKPGRRVADRPIDYAGFDVPDVFVVGYGLDYEQRYRNLACIAVINLELSLS